MRTFNSGWPFSALLISSAHNTGASGRSSKDERATVARGQSQQLAFRFGFLALLGSADDRFQRLNLVALLVDEQFRVTDNVDEQDMPDLELNVGPRIGRHVF